MNGKIKCNVQLSNLEELDKCTLPIREERTMYWKKNETNHIMCKMIICLKQ